MVLSRLAEQWALPVVPYNTRYFALSANHPMFQGSMPGPLLEDADLVIVIESDVPWLPSKEQPPAGARIVQIGEDPLYARYPMRSFPSDLTITATSSVRAGVVGAGTAADATARTWRIGATRLAARSADAARANGEQEAEQAGRGNKNTLAWLNHCLRDVVDRDTMVISEYSFRQEYCPLETPGQPVRGQCGRWAGLGIRCVTRRKARIAGPHGAVGAWRWRLYVCQSDSVSLRRADAETAGADGDLQQRAVWRGAARDAGHVRQRPGRAKADGRLLADLPAPSFEKIVAAHDGHGERVERPADLPAALRRAADAVRGGQQALVNVICPP